MRSLAAALAALLLNLSAPSAFAQSQEDGSQAQGEQHQQEQSGQQEQPPEQSGESESGQAESGQEQSEQDGALPSDMPSPSDPEAFGLWVQEQLGGGGDDSPAATEEQTRLEEIIAAAEAGDTDKLLGLIGPYLLSIILDVLAVIGILVAALLIGAWLRKALRHGLTKIRVEQTIAQFAGNIARWGILLVALVMCLERFGINVTSLAALIGAAALTIGLAFQGALSNVAAGVMLLIFRPFKVDEWVELDGELGIVEDIDLFYTHINQFDNRHIVLPNSKVLEGKIESLTHNPVRRVHLPVGVAYGTDLTACERALGKAARDPEEALNSRDPMVILTGFGDSSIDWEVRVWCDSKRYLALRHQLVHAIDIRLREAGITIPFPQRDLNTNRPLRITLESDGSAAAPASRAGDGQARPAARIADETESDDDGGGDGGDGDGGR